MYILVAFVESSDKESALECVWVALIVNRIEPEGGIVTSVATVSVVVVGVVAVAVAVTVAVVAALMALVVLVSELFFPHPIERHSRRGEKRKSRGCVVFLMQWSLVSAFLHGLIGGEREILIL